MMAVKRLGGHDVEWSKVYAATGDRGPLGEMMTVQLWIGDQADPIPLYGKEAKEAWDLIESDRSRFGMIDYFGFDKSKIRAVEFNVPIGNSRIVFEDQNAFLKMSGEIFHLLLGQLRGHLTGGTSEIFSRIDDASLRGEIFQWTMSHRIYKDVLKAAAGQYKDDRLKAAMNEIISGEGLNQFIEDRKTLRIAVSF